MREKINDGGSEMAIKEVLREYHRLEDERLGYYSIRHAAFLYIVELEREIRIFWLEKRPVEKPKTPWARLASAVLKREEFEGPDRKVDVGLFELGANDKILTILSNDGVSVTTERYHNLGSLLKSAQGVGFRVVKRAQEILGRQDRDRKLSDPFYIEIVDWPGGLPGISGRN